VQLSAAAAAVAARTLALLLPLLLLLPRLLGWQQVLRARLGLCYLHQRQQQCRD
jgi:hypothetical protein